MDYSQLSSMRLYMIRSTDPVGIDAELDRRNAEAARKTQPKKKTRKPKYRMADYEYEQQAAKYWGC